MNKKFTVPQPSVQEIADGVVTTPPTVEPCIWLEEIATGHLHPYNERMAQRGDLVRAYVGDPPDQEQVRKQALKERAKEITKEGKAKALAAAPPAPVAPIPTPPAPIGALYNAHE
jgi:hypothetical protein